MPTMVLTAAYVALNGVTWHHRTKKVELQTEVEEKDVTTFASLGWKEVIGGLRSGGLSITFINNNSAGDLDELLWAQLGNVITFEVRGTQGTVTTSNPKYTGSVLVKGWTPVSGGPGDVVEVDVDFPTSGVVTRGTS